MALNQHASSYSEHALFELPTYNSRLVRVQDLLNSKMLGTSLRLLHEMDVDFISINSRISAAVTNSDGRNISWYMMKGKPGLPVHDCDSDTWCVASKYSHDGFVRFGKIEFQEEDPYYVCANVSARGDHSGFAVCGNGFIVDETPPLEGSVSITNAVSGFLTDSSHMYITWSGFHDNNPARLNSYANDIKSYSVAIGWYICLEM